MQKLKSKVCEKLQIEDKLQTVKGLLNNPVFQSAVAALISMGFLSWLHIKPLGLLFIIVLCVWYYKNRCNLCIQTPPELEKHFKLVQQTIVDFRKAKPTMFCLIASGCLGALAVIGHLVSGSMVVMTGLIFAAIISTKYNFKIMQIEPQDFAWSESLQHDFEIDDEFIPEENENNLFVLERAGDLASITLPTEDGETDEEKSEEVPSELLIPDSIPEIDESSTDDDQDDLLPIVPYSKSEAQTKDSNPTNVANDTIEFKKSHFKRDSSLSNTSSSSEESLSKGLQFPDCTEVDGKSKSKSSSNPLAKPITSRQAENDADDLLALKMQTQTPGMWASSSNLIPTLMTGLVQGILGTGSGELASHSNPIHNPPTHRRLVTALDSSDESDFEMLEKDDCE